MFVCGESGGVNICIGMSDTVHLYVGLYGYVHMCTDV